MGTYRTILPVVPCQIKFWRNIGPTVRLCGTYVSPEFNMTWDHRQNCPIGQPSTKKWFLGPEMHGPCHKSKEKLGEIRSLLVTLRGTLWVQKFFLLYKIIYELQFVFYNFFV